MATIVIDCPHCTTKNVSLRIAGEFARPSHPKEAVLSATCSACNMPIIALFRSDNSISSMNSPVAFHGNLLSIQSKFTKIAIYPNEAPDETPASIPDTVGRAFRQAAASRTAGHFDAACSMYRKAMEVGLKAFSPDIEAWKIEKRIDKMAAEHRITPELQRWAHELRLDGNDALHSDGEATESMATDMHELCKFLLIYLYTLPAQVEEATARRNSQE